MKKIKEVIEISGLSRRTLQYYDDTGLMDNRRTAGNYRVYGEGDLQRLWKIILYKEMGFQLDEIRKILNSDESDINSLMNTKVNSIEQKISELQRMLDFVKRVIDYGLPAMNSDDFRTGDINMAENARRLSERK